MRKIAKALAVLLLATGSATPALAFTPGGAFTLTGPVTFIGPPTLTCTGTFNVAPSGSGAAIVSASFTGPAPCSGFVAAAGLPWPLTTTPTTVTISPAIKFGVYLCGPTAITGTWSNLSPGTLTFTSALVTPSCLINATLSASPPQTLP